MDPRQLIPSVDPAPLPAPAWLFQTLLFVTFLLHLLPMNFLVGGGFSSLYLKLRRPGDDHGKQLGDDLRRMLPTVVAATVTLGVAPLLFLQVLYGQLFYSSSILIGSAWLLIVPLLIFAYYSFYRDSFSSASRLLILLAWLAVIYTGFTLSYNNQLLADPSAWPGHFSLESAGRFAFGGELLGTVFASRWLHMMTGAIAVTGLWFFIMGLAKSNSDATYARFLKRRGAAWFLWGTVASIITGFWFLFAIPETLREDFMNGHMNGGLTWMLTLPLSLLAAFMLRAAGGRQGAGAPGKLGLVLAFISLLSMIWLRHNLRAASLEQSLGFRVGDLPSSPQWGVLGLFLLVFLIGLIVLFWMLRFALSEKKR